MKKGSKRSEESKRKQGESNKGHIVSQATRDKISSSHMGIGHTEETKEVLRKAAIRQYHLRPYESVYNTVRCNAKRRGMEITLTFEEFLDIVKTGECFYCGKILYWPEYNAKKTSQASNIDRKDNTKGYLTGNVVACCWSCNNIKSDHFTFEQFCEVGKLLRAWNFPGSVKELPSYLNCVYCPSQSYLQKKFVHDRFAKYMCLLKHEFYIEKNEDTKELVEKSTTQATVMYSENRCKHKNLSGHPADQDIRIYHDCDMRSLDGGKKWVTLPWATLPHKKE